MQRKWTIACTLFAIGALNYGDRTAIASVYPLLRSELGLSDILIAALGSAFLWSYAIGSPIAGYVADRLSRRKILICSVATWSCIMALTAFVHSPSMLVLSRVLLGLAECAYLPASVALIADHHDVDTRGTAMALQVAGMNLGLVGGSTLAGYLGEKLGWRADFLILGGVGLVLSVAARFLIHDGPRARQVKSIPVGKALRELTRLPTYLGVIGGAMLIAIGTWIFLNWLPLYFHDHFRMSLAGAGFSSSAILQVASVAGVILGGYISDRVARIAPNRRILFLAFSYLCTAPFLLPFLWNAALGTINVCVFSYSFIKSVGSASECPIICETAGRQLRSTALGIMNMLNCFAGGLGVLIAGVLKQRYGLGAVFGGVSVTVFLAGVVVLIGYFLLLRYGSGTTDPGDAAGSLVASSQSFSVEFRALHHDLPGGIATKKES